MRDDPLVWMRQVERDATLRVAASGTVWRIWGQGPALILLHGGAGSWTHWIANVEALALRYRVFVPDMPGFGDSPPATPRDDPHAIAGRLALDIDEIVGTLSAYHLVGFSFGGLIAGLIAAKERARIERLVLVGPGGMGFVTSTRLALEGWRHVSDEAERMSVHRHNLAVLMIADGGRIDDVAVALQANNAERARVNSRPISRRPYLRNALADLNVPLGGIWGASDAVLDGDLDKRVALLRAAWPSAPVVVIPETGHWVQYESADAFNTALCEMLLVSARDPLAR
jgi:2-hydroxy-6-oxonona-2,4-dienedioate hydrolase